MKKTVKTRTVIKPVEVPVYVTEGGVEYENEQSAKGHEVLTKKYPKLSKYDIKWIDGYMHEAEHNEGYEEFMKALKSKKVLLLCSHSGGDDLFFEVIEPHLVAVEAVIKVLHRRSVGMNYNRYVDGVIYKGESLCFNDEKKDDGSYYETGSGRNIKEVLK